MNQTSPQSATLPPEEVAKIARLARLKLSSDELTLYSRQIGQILDFMNVLREVDTTGIEPMVSAVPCENVFRQDVVVDSLPRKTVLANAPRTDGKFFLVPNILG
jgi:aspartyl-tRNA(Asn)/glutamyl-tRNA(Gln) amidotransferase subunit C